MAGGYHCSFIGGIIRQKVDCSLTIVHKNGNWFTSLVKDVEIYKKEIHKQKQINF